MARLINGSIKYLKEFNASILGDNHMLTGLCFYKWGGGHIDVSQEMAKCVSETKRSLKAIQWRFHI